MSGGLSAHLAANKQTYTQIDTLAHTHIPGRDESDTHCGCEGHTMLELATCVSVYIYKYLCNCVCICNKSDENGNNNNDSRKENEMAK